MGAESYVEGTIAFSEPVPVEGITRELAELRPLERLFTLTYSDDATALHGLSSGQDNDWGSSREWDLVLAVLETIAGQHKRTLHTDAKWESDPGHSQGTLVVDTAGRFHHVFEGDDPAVHHTRHCNCHAHQDPQACEQCGSAGFLAREDDLPTAPALCVDCHESAGTRQAADGHQCRDYCALDTDHTGLCRP
ncbi:MULTISPECIES: hypothetical protein [Streptomyces]|uniref:Uncharacterized protein n=1 Tax=Streptomyces zinciresistens K42 TaxID=700597 RepID=G2GEX2_9ACTN|nr:MULTISPECIES: hypothetical protein [Streptomyces]EGX57913.1 hypothetical protein SZN_20277 [Streptomyces zinciresistens K42]MDT9700182.1 hypothetical protein [Streptomyces sp. P17]